MKMNVSTALWIVTAILAPGGTMVTVLNFHTSDEWFYLGLLLIGIAGICLNAGLVACRSRTLDQEYDSGYDAGFRDGRREAKPVVVKIDQGRTKNGGIPKTPFRPLAGISSPARRTPTDQD
jgi:hypothetical protein